MLNSQQSIAILIPCYNEEAGIADVVNAFKKHIPTATIYVYDNNSIDQTIARARNAGAVVRVESRQGKGNVVRRMFADIEADLYIMIDGDGTYDASAAPTLIQQLVENNLDMVIGTRKEESSTAHRVGHKFGNTLFNWVLSFLFNSPFKDIFSGYRVFSRRFVKSFPPLSSGFDIETELSIYALEMQLPVKEIETAFFDRAEGSFSKLSTFKDGFRILWRMIFLFKERKPMLFFGAFFFLFMTIASILSTVLIKDFLATGLVARIPTAIICVGSIVLGFLSLACGLILDSVSCARREAKIMHYLHFKAP
jgi:glycosyltransferase involved in cell wall biosynthesis